MSFSSKSLAPVVDTAPKNILFSNSYNRVPKMIKSIDQARRNYELEIEKKKAEECEKKKKEFDEAMKNIKTIDPYKNFVEPKVVHSLYYYE